jgi:large subunit ribosomal protein L4
MPKTILKNKIEADIYNLEGKVSGKIELPSEIFGAEVNSKLLAQSIRVYLANQRLGTRDTKTRSEVTGSTKKIYRQKGTGRARHGDIKAPIFKGGGVTHGPKPKDFSLDFPKKMKRKALFAALTDKYINNGIKIVKSLKDLEQKTKNLATVLNNFQLYDKMKSGKEKTLLITDEYRSNLILAGRNIKNLDMTSVSLLNTYEILTHKNLIFLQESIGKISELFLETKKEKKPLNKQKKTEVSATKTIDKVKTKPVKSAKKIQTVKIKVKKTVNKNKITKKS